ncbi:hypothetical protein BP6252_13523 [Coleophoma cylindrospora]|uniref:Allantoin permease n=1 Tax=Coleophoma cylindrospora TaxID=1849047 RepID=A0A3D8Q8F5_9HELO|nr:hypothetical protein BP6252_13523 [Coleophoma cylindrospora]
MVASKLQVTAQKAFTTRKGFLSTIQTPETDRASEGEENGDKITSNPDLDPTPVEARKWGSFAFFMFEFSVAFAPTSYNVGASLISIGLPYYAIIISAFIASFMCSVVIYFNSRGASIYHVGFPVYVRMSAGIRGSLFFIGIRGVVAILYMATQTYYASELTVVCLRCIFGHKWTDIPNHLPKSAGITSSGLAAFMIFWIIQLPFAWIHPSKVAPVFAAKSIVAPPVLIITMIWALTKAGGPHWELFNSQNHLSHSAAGWAWLKAINSIVSGTLPPLINIPDLARYARRPESIRPMTYGLFFSKPLITIIGILTTAAGNKLFGQAYWNLWDLYGAVLDTYWGPGTRTLVFLASLTQVYATMCTNISSNSIPVGCDLAGLFPRYFTIRRGQILCSILALAICPWKMVYSASSFLSFLGSYVCLITPIAACEIVDYWFVRRGNVHVPSLYKASSASPYWYNNGWNPRAYGAWLCGVGIAISGIAGVLSPGSVPTMAVNLYNTSFILSGATSAVAYFIFNKIWPVKIYPDGPHANEESSFEFMRKSEGYFDDEEVIGEAVLVGSEIGNIEGTGEGVGLEKV